VRDIVPKVLDFLEVFVELGLTRHSPFAPCSVRLKPPSAILQAILVRGSRRILCNGDDCVPTAKGRRRLSAFSIRSAAVVKRVLIPALTPQSRYGARGADTAARSVGDLEKPWEWDGKRGLASHRLKD